ncbi:hypothetical protein A4A49_11175 [Nicotiana attenuata]|uniref:Uncharacterized protein n=1 Tax=Nicotiana attenuata TaxID=49451 RepID=A0A1J6IEX2_NICAT|nr:hypothetical protein A4A49_11175 [Nicotiana attenuata]
MGKTSSSDQVAVHSSISLLQERFKQLQKVKKKRQEKQLLKMLSITADDHLQPYNIDKLYFQSEKNKYFLPDNNISKVSSSQVSLSLWPETTLVVKSPQLKLDNSYSDVDTSLHL